MTSFQSWNMTLFRRWNLTFFFNVEIRRFFYVEIWRWNNVEILCCFNAEIQRWKWVVFQTLKSITLYQRWKLVVQRCELKSTLKQRWNNVVCRLGLYNEVIYWYWKQHCSFCSPLFLFDCFPFCLIWRMHKQWHYYENFKRRTSTLRFESQTGYSFSFWFLIFFLNCTSVPLNLFKTQWHFDEIHHCTLSKWLSRSLFLYFNYMVSVTAGWPMSPRGHM